MAFLINYSDSATGVSITGAYLKITSVLVDKTAKAALIKTAIYANQAARLANLQPIATQQYICKDLVSAGSPTAQPSVNALYSGYFGGPQLADALNKTPATNLDDILLSQAYLALQAHPQATTLLTGAKAEVATTTVTAPAS